MTSELFSSVYKEKSDHLFDDRVFSCPVPAFTHWSIFVPLSENPLDFETSLIGGDKRNRTTDFLNAMAREVKTQ